MRKSNEGAFTVRTLIRNPLWKQLFVLFSVIPGFFIFAPVVESSNEDAIHARLNSRILTAGRLYGQETESLRWENGAISFYPMIRGIPGVRRRMCPHAQRSQGYILQIKIQGAP